MPEIRGLGFGAKGLRFRPQSHNALPERPSAHPVFSPLQTVQYYLPLLQWIVMKVSRTADAQAR